MRQHLFAAALPLALGALFVEACVGDLPAVQATGTDAGGGTDAASTDAPVADAPAQDAPSDRGDSGAQAEADATPSPDGGTDAAPPPDAGSDADAGSAADAGHEVPVDHLVGWWCADAIDVTKDASGLVSTWADKSPAHNDAVQTTAALQPTWKSDVVKGHAVVSFAGAQFLATRAVTLATFTACVTFAGTGQGFLVAQSADPTTQDGFYMFTANNATVLVRRGNNASGWDAPSTWGTDGVWKVACTTFDGTHAGTLLYIDGALQVMSSRVSTDPGAVGVSQPIYLGAGSNGGTSTVDPLVGSIREVVLYDTAQPASVVGQITSILRSRSSL